MTTDIEIKAGLELDRAVAGLIGLTCTHRVLGTDEEYYVDPRDGASAIPRRFQPSTDLNAAFAAAEAVGLWEDKYFLAPIGSIWRCYQLDWGYVNISDAATPSLAICAAILKLGATRTSQ